MSDKLIAGMTADQILVQLHEPRTIERVIEWMRYNEAIFTAVVNSSKYPQGSGDFYRTLVAAYVAISNKREQQFLDLVRNLKPPDVYEGTKKYTYNKLTEEAQLESGLNGVVNNE